MTTKAVHIVDIGLFQPGGTITGEAELTLGAQPLGALALSLVTPSTSGVLSISDDGYRSRADDPDGVQVWHPLIREGFSIDRGLRLEPGAAAAAWGFGSITIYDDGSISSIMRAWNVAAQTITVRRGEKTVERFTGYRSARASKGWAVGYDGSYVEYPAYAIRYNYSGGVPTLLDETAEVNECTNPRAEGVSAGSPGTAPTGWFVSGSIGGLTRTIVGTGTSGGVPYCDIKWAGTTTGTTTLQILPTGAAGISGAATGETWTESQFMSVAAGSLGSPTLSQITLQELVGGVDSARSTSAVTPTSSALAGQRSSLTRTLTHASVDAVRTGYQLQYPISTAVDVTIRFGWPQVEERTAVSTPILPEVGVPAASTRIADKLYLQREIWEHPSINDMSTVFVGLAEGWQASEGAVTIPIADAAYWLGQPISTTVYAGTGTYEGPAALAGKSKPLTRGTAYNITPLEIDATNRVWQYNAGKGTVAALYERGAATITFESDTTNLYAGSTSAGKYRTDNSRGLFQLGSVPAGDITCDVTGEFPTAGNKTVAADIARYLLTETAAVPSAFVNTTSFSDAATAYAYASGIHVPAGSGMTALDAVSYLLESFGAKLYPGRDGALRVLALRTIGATETIAAAFGPHNVRKVTPLAMPAALTQPVWRVRCAYAKNYTIQTDVSASATAAHRQEIAEPHKTVAYSDAAVQAAYRRPAELPPFGGALTSSANAQTVVDAIGLLWKSTRTLYAMEVPVSVGLDLDFGQVVSITYPLDVLAQGAFGRIVGEQYRTRDGITFQVLV